MLKAEGTQGRYSHITACQMFSKAFVLVLSWYLCCSRGSRSSRPHSASRCKGRCGEAKAGISTPAVLPFLPESGSQTTNRLGGCLWGHCPRQVLLAFGELGLWILCRTGEEESGLRGGCMRGVWNFWGYLCIAELLRHHLVGHFSFLSSVFLLLFLFLKK